jgi:pyruvate kinase
MSDAIKAKAICTLTNSGYTAFQISAWTISTYFSIYIKQKNPYATKFVMG